MSLFFLQGAPGEPGLPGDRGNPVGHMQYHNPRGWFIFYSWKLPILQLYAILPSKHFLVEPTEEPNLLS